MNPVSSAIKRALIVGCGDLGLRVAPLLAARGYAVTGARRNTAALPETISALALDVTSTESTAALAGTQWDLVLITLTAGGAGNYEAVYVQGLQNVLAHLPGRPFVVMASSTSVYAQQQGEWIDENSETEPAAANGKALLKAESILQNSAFDSIIMRYSGIYGGGRHNHLLSVLQQGRIAPSEPLHYSNRIHEVDAARVIDHLVERFEQGAPLEPLYLASDGKPAALREVMMWLAQREGIDVETLVEDYLPRRGGNRRCSNQRLVDSGFSCQYGDYKVGFAAGA